MGKVLKPCPFCGYNRVAFLLDEYEDGTCVWLSQCQNCGASAKGGYTKEEAMREWNRRVNNGN